MKKSVSGFTIVELIVVIAAIAILATITFVAYSGVRANANDTQIRAAATKIQQNIQLWGSQTGISAPLAGWGSTGPASGDACPGATTASGWFQTGIYNCSMQDLLIARGLLSATTFSDLPKNNTTGSNTTVFMFYPCTNTSGSYVLMWYLNNPSSTEVANFESITQQCYGQASTSTAYYTNYGMRNGVIIKMR